MLKKLMLPILIISIAIQLLVPVGMIVYGNKAEEDFLKHGKEFRIPVYIQSIYDGSVDVRFYDYNLYRIGTYAVMKEDEDGFANLSTIVEAKPKTPDYISVTWENKEKLAGFTIDSDFSSSRVNPRKETISQTYFLALLSFSPIPPVNTTASIPPIAAA